jgi:GntR family transcriptional regulator
MIQIHRRKHTPIYVQIGDAIRQQIEHGTLKVGDILSSERELSEQLNISRMTVRAALDKLVQDGLLIRQRGRGTIVAAAKITRSASAFVSFTEDMQARGFQVYSQVLTFRSESASPSTAAQLGLGTGAKVIFLHRVRLTDGEPLAVERVYLPFSRFGALLGMDLSAYSLYTMLEQKFDCYPTVADETVEAVMLTASDADVLHVDHGSPALLARRITRDRDGMPIEAVETLYRADRYRMIFTRTR